MHFGAFTALGAIIAAMRATFRRGLERPAVQDDGARLFVAAFGQTEQRPQVMDQRRKAAPLLPTLELLVDGGPRRQIVGQHAPLGAGSGQSAQSIEHFSEVVLALAGILPYQG
jgi:hypothetical protein